MKLTNFEGEKEKQTSIPINMTFRNILLLPLFALLCPSAAMAQGSATLVLWHADGTTTEFTRP